MRLLAAFLGLAFLMLVGAAVGLWYIKDQEARLYEPLPLTKTLTYVVEPGMTLRQVASDLEGLGALQTPRSFVWWARWQGLANNIKAGEYEIVPGASPVSLLQDLVDGKVLQRALTLVEGWNFAQVMDAVNGSPHLIHTMEGLDDTAVMARLGFSGVHPEGRFLPDTYLFPNGTTDVDFLQRAYRSMEMHLAQAWEEREENLPLDTPYDALILASIVEKETGVAEERPRIAGVFARRLQKGMRLETDPTVIYGIGESFDGNLRRKHLRQDTPYNTYVRRGLPPTPIAMPGSDAIHAALHPDPGPELYFVAKGDGSHYFSPTYDEHKEAVRRYQLKRKPTTGDD